MICPYYLCRMSTLCIVYSKSTLFALVSPEFYIASASALFFEIASLSLFCFDFEWIIVSCLCGEDDEDLDFFLRSFSFENRIDF